MRPESRRLGARADRRTWQFFPPQIAPQIRYNGQEYRKISRPGPQIRYRVLHMNLQFTFRKS